MSRPDMFIVQIYSCTRHVHAPDMFMLQTCPCPASESANSKNHDKFALPKDSNCETCDVSRMKEEPARKHPAGHKDPRLEANKFGDVVHLDTLFLTIGQDGMIEVADESAGAIQLQVFKDEATEDVEAIQTQSRHWKNVRDAIVEFGGD